MTEEEKLAEEYAKANAKKGLSYREVTRTYDEITGYPYFLEDKIKKAFLAGLWIGKPKWHKVADGDFPTPNVKVDVWVKLSKNFETEYIAYWRPTIKKWQIYNLIEASRQVKDEDFLDENEVIAWCESPKYTEE